MKVGSGKSGVELGNYKYAALNSDGDSFVQPVNSGMHPDFLDNQNQYGAQHFQNVNYAPRVEEIPSQKEHEEKEIKYIVHKVEYTDSMEGLSLQYNVSEREIRLFNGLTTNDIYYLKELKIPNPDLQNLHPQEDQYDVEELRRQEKTRAFKALIDKTDHKAAQFYLEEYEWNVDVAFENYKRDVEFEKKYQISTDQKNANSKINKYKGTELLDKKNM